MISEIDIRDWAENITVVRKAVDSLSELPTPYPYEQVAAIEDFIEKVESYVHNHKREMAALLRAPLPSI